MSLYNDPELEIKCFHIPIDGRIPLHDHPHMTVFQKVLEGTMRYMDGDLDYNDVYELGDEKMPKLIPHADYLIDSTEPTQIVSPDKGNLHEVQVVGE
jgi:hypothetical protein